MFPRFKLRKKQPKPLDEKTMTAILQRQTELQKQNINDVLREIERDKEKSRMWNSLSTRDKIKLLKYIEERGNHGKQISTKSTWFKNKKKKV